MEKITTKNPDETFALGKKTGQSCRGGEVFLLLGDLGAGKTCFTQGLAKGLGVKTKVVSPTFNIMKLYKTKSGLLCHIDAYRLNSGEDLSKIGLDDYLGQADVVTVIEWAERVKDIWPRKKIKITIKNNGSAREFKIS